jgi:hypothetical protein
VLIHGFSKTNTKMILNNLSDNDQFSGSLFDCALS